MSRAVIGFVAAVCLSGVATVGAQSQPPTQPPSQPPSSPAAAAQPADSPVVTVIGCVQKENAVIKGGAATTAEPGMGDEFVLTNAKLSTGAPAMDQAPAAGEPSGSPSNFGKVYRVTGDKEGDLKALVGQRVEISGAFKNAADATKELSTVGTSGRTAGEPSKGNTPEITIASVKPSTGSCGAAK
jgi:hypothetical protein